MLLYTNTKSYQKLMCPISLICYYRVLSLQCLLLTYITGCDASPGTRRRESDRPIKGHIHQPWSPTPAEPDGDTRRLYPDHDGPPQGALRHRVHTGDG